MGIMSDQETVPSSTRVRANPRRRSATRILADVARIGAAAVAAIAVAAALVIAAAGGAVALALVALAFAATRRRPQHPAVRAAASLRPEGPAVLRLDDPSAWKVLRP
jgi:hypothetical protein